MRGLSPCCAGTNDSVRPTAVVAHCAPQQNSSVLVGQLRTPWASAGTPARAIARTRVKQRPYHPIGPIGRTARCDWIAYPLFRTRSAGLGPRPDDAVELRSCDRNRLALRAVDARPGLPSPRDELFLPQMPDRCP